jgi:hypothetical protein
MQNAYASGHTTQLIGRFSWAPADAVHVAESLSGELQVKLEVVGAKLLSSDAAHPASNAPGVPLFASPFPSFR